MSNLPAALTEALDEEIHRYPYNQLQHAAEELSQRYRQHKTGKIISSDVDRLAYVAVRLPATYAVVRRVLQEVQMVLPQASLESVLDLGSGPGTVLWAAADVLANLRQMTAVEQDGDLIVLGQRLASHSLSPAVQNARWEKHNLALLPALEPHDVVVLSYVIGELSPETLEPLLLRAWQAARVALVVIEPGTPHHFTRVLLARSLMIQSGAFIAAPCPHIKPCPLAAMGDWCHFSERVERSRLHRHLKGAELGYEDEKYSYIVASKIPGLSQGARIVRAPQKHSGHIEFQLCTAEGSIKRETVSRRHGDTYKKARKLDWGDTLPS